METADNVNDSRPELLEAPEADSQFADAIAAMQGAGRPRVRVRILAQLYRFGKDGKRYLNWRGVVWRLDLDPTVIAGSNFRAALSTFFDSVAKVGPNKVIAALQAAMREE